MTTTLAADPDAEDSRLAQAGDAGAFERIYRRHAARIHSLARRLVGPDEADEATQDAFVRAWEKLALFRGDALFGTWLYRLAINVMLGRRGSTAKRDERFGGGDPAVLPLSGRRDRVDLRMDFERAVEELPTGARQVFVLHDVEGFTHEEIAQQLAVSVGTSKSQLHRARMTLRQYLG
ncbi:MAG: sigma-70 family RNA polymerase sigma factor [Gemmatimonadetes bacterium]|nr:sigma-70 family RNA polymerase sigma factor [Gemmatimonadota bacterium]